MRYVVSVLHHSIPSIRPGALAEEDDVGWHFRAAKALTRYGGFKAVAMRPSGSEDYLTKIIEDVPVVLTPTINLSPSRRLLKWSEYSPALAQLTEYLVKRHEAVPYIHEYRALNSELIIRRLINYPMILQHHGSRPPMLRNALRPDLISDVKELSKIRRETLLKRVKGAIFVINRVEKEYLESLGVDAEVMVRTMAVDFNELKPPSMEEKRKLRIKYGIPEDAVVLTTYTGVFGEEFSTLKGTHLIARLWKDLRRVLNIRLMLMVTGLGEAWVKAFRELGIVAYGFLPHKTFIELLKASDAYFLMATPGYYGGIGVAVMEALALGKPVVSPTLTDYPELREVKYLGAVTEYVSNEDDYYEFLKALTYIVENINNYKSELIRSLAYRHYSWESFIKNFIQVINKL
ncbi:glycosyl transferase group 1 [Vulcanisaeta distributa DSM 14429]|uniref:Glycosyl transferase group 1 n=2 Tax=Vulcanisaeta distributa TaxID=164451 RepID=E1QUE1_VULDI|nr:glycosyl transferase group 1 [Vulcanisaeta distributa DSM 14429]